MAIDVINKKLLNIFLKTLILITISYSYGHCQSTLKSDEVGRYLSDSLRSYFYNYDSLYLSFFVKFKVNINGHIDSVSINNSINEEINYDKYIAKTNSESLKQLYGMMKKAYLIKSTIFSLLAKDALNISPNPADQAYYLLPIQVDFRKRKFEYSYNTDFGALKIIFTPGLKQYYFLSPVKVELPCKNCL